METQRTDTSEALPQTISDAAWKSLLPFLKGFPNVYVGNPETCRRFLSAVIWITIYRRFGRWCDAGVFEALHEHFHDAGEISRLLVDSTMVRAHSCVAGTQKKRRTRCSMPRAEPWRIYDEIESFSQRCLGALRLILTPRHRNDITQASALIQGYDYKSVIGDKVSYDSDAFRGRSSLRVEWL